jgi:5-methylcytosine-specific restriction endonuclease McrA
MGKRERAVFTCNGGRSASCGHLGTHSVSHIPPLKKGEKKPGLIAAPEQQRQEENGTRR